MQKVIEAFTFALERHAGQYRKDGETPYIVHPFRVFLWLADKAKIYDEEVLAAAFLHDLIEDTKTDYDELKENFGKEIADIVSVLTKDKRLPERLREQKFNNRLAQADWRAKILKLADIHDNVSDMHSWKAPKFEKIRKLEEKLEQIKFIQKNLPPKHKPILKIVLDHSHQVKMNIQHHE